MVPKYSNLPGLDLCVWKGLFDVDVWLENHTAVGIVEDHRKSSKNFRANHPLMVWDARATCVRRSVQPIGSQLEI